MIDHEKENGTESAYSHGTPGIKKKETPIDQIDRYTGNIIATHKSIEAAGRSMVCSGSAIGIALREKRACKGFLFRYSGTSQEDQFLDKPVIKICCNTGIRTEFGTIAEAAKDACVSAPALRTRILTDVHRNDHHWIFKPKTVKKSVLDAKIEEDTTIKEEVKEEKVTPEIKVTEYVPEIKVTEVKDSPKIEEPIKKETETESDNEVDAKEVADINKKVTVCSKSVMQMDIDGNELYRYTSILSASVTLKLPRAMIRNAANDGTVYNNFKFKYIEKSGLIGMKLAYRKGTGIEKVDVQTNEVVAEYASSVEASESVPTTKAKFAHILKTKKVIDECFFRKKETM